MEYTNQRSAFMEGEGDAWFKRNLNYVPDQLDHVDRSILNNIQPAGSILEVGCADGRRLARIRSFVHSDAKLVGIDPSQAAIDSGMSKFSELDLRVGTADQLPFDEFFNTVIIGFCLYLCDRSLLTKIVSEVDRVLVENGTLIIVDFDPPHPRRRRYRHLDGLWSYKMNYADIFTAFPQFVLSSKYSMSHTSELWEGDETERIAVSTIRKNTEYGYSLEPDV